MNKNLLLYALGGFAIFYLLFRKGSPSTSTSSEEQLEPQTEVPLDETSSAPTPPMRGGVIEAQVIDLPSGTTIPSGYVSSNVVTNTQGTPITQQTQQNRKSSLFGKRTPRFSDVQQFSKAKLFGLQVPRIGVGQSTSDMSFGGFRKPKIVNYTNLQRITPYDDASRIVRYKDKTFGDIVVSEINQNQEMVWYFEANRYPISILYPKR
jgi:hypothetical protein